MNPDDMLAEWERLTQEATEAPWGIVDTTDPDYPSSRQFTVGHGVSSTSKHWDESALAYSQPDAEFIAAARTAWPAATAALRVVLDLHRPDPASGTTWCRRCGEAWPCATAQAVNDAVGGQG